MGLRPMTRLLAFSAICIARSVGQPFGSFPGSGAFGAGGSCGQGPGPSPIGGDPVAPLAGGLGRLASGDAHTVLSEASKALGSGLGGALDTTGFGEYAPSSLHRGFHYADIAAFLLQPPKPYSVQECQRLCIDNATCAAWEVCAPLGDGCDGCYLVTRAPRRFSDRPGWHAEVLTGREELGWDETSLAEMNMTAENCHAFLLEANGADQSKPFHEPAIMQRYTNCAFILRDEEKPRQLFMSGQHWPVTLITNFREPPVLLPQEVEQEVFSASGHRQAAASQPGVVNAQLHATVGTKPWEEHIQEKPQGPHAFVLPFYDTNIGHWMKQHGSMNPLQSYEMQSLLRPGDVVVDVGANLGCYTVPMAERVGPSGKVLAFEPFRWMQQLVSANVAMNGLSNVWVFPVGLSTEFNQFEARPPQLRFFSSPGGMKLRAQTDGMKNEEAMQLYDWDSSPEILTTVSLDEIIAHRSAHTTLLGVPPVDNVRLIKIDVEGMEKEVIAGAQLVIQHFKPIIWTENVAYFSSNGQDTSLLQIMEQLEYACAGAQNAPNDIICTDKYGRGHQVTTT